MAIGESAAHDVARHILARIPGLSTSTVSPPSVRAGDIFPVAKDVSALAVICRNVAGEQEIPFVEGGNGHREERPEVQVLVRGDKDDPRTAEALLEAIVAVVAAQDADGLVSGYFDAKLRVSAILNLGQDPDGFPLFAASFGLKRNARLRPIYTGAAAPPGAMDAAFIQGLSSVTVGTRRTSIWSATAGAGEHLWWACPVDWLGGTPAFYDGIVGRTTIAFSQVATANLSIDGIAVPYALYRSTATNSGAKTVKTL